MRKNEKSKLKALSDIASTDITFEFNEILHNILKITCEAMNAHSGTMMLVDEEDNKLKMAASYGLPHDYIERVYDAARKAGVRIISSPSGTVLKTGKYYLVPDIFKEPRDRPWYDLSREFGFSSQIFTPMKRGSKVIGLLNMYMAKVHNFTDEEINFVTIAASQASSVVQNARMCIKLKNNFLELKGYKDHLEDKIKAAYKKLYDSEKYLRTIIESSLDGIAVADEQGRFEFGNNSFFNIIGWQREEIIGQLFTRIVSEDMKESVQESWKDVQVENARYNEATIITRRGERKYLNLSNAKVSIKGENKIVIIIKDITGNKKLELAIKESEERYKDLFENANDSIYIYDSGGYFKEVNQTALKLLGCTKEEIIGTHISKWITPASFKTTQENLKSRIAGEPVEEPFVLEVICKNGEHRWMEIKRRLIKDGDRVIAVHGIGRDITETKRLKQELKESNKQLKLLWYVMAGTRGGKTRALILKCLHERPHNTNQLAEVLNLDYKTVKHHLNVLFKNGIIAQETDGYIKLFFISKNMEMHLNEFTRSNPDKGQD